MNKRSFLVFFLLILLGMCVCFGYTDEVVVVQEVVPVSDRTSAVGDAIVAAVVGVVDASDVTADHLALITSLNLRGAGITVLKSGDFSGLVGLINLNLFGNKLSALPSGIFEGLSSLTTLRLGGNAVDPLPLSVSLEKVGAGEFKAVAATGATFDFVLPLTVANGSITGGGSTLTIPHGRTESGVLTVVRAAGTTGAVAVDIGTLPGLPRNHYGYVLIKSDTLPLTVIDEINTAPVFTEGTAVARTVAENTDASVNIGEPIAATDANGDTLTYTLGGTDAVSFAIDSSSGQLQTKAALDYETKPSYAVIVSVSDGKGGIDSIDVSISVTDIEEVVPVDKLNTGPTFVEGDITVRAVVENVAIGTSIGAPVSATDAEKDTLSWTLGGADAGVFELDSTTGQLKAKVPLDYEVRRVYSVMLTVSDEEFSDTIVVIIGVIDVSDTVIAAGVVPVVDRTPAVRDAIVAAVPGVTDAAQVTATHLALITSLNLRDAGITALKTGDFSGLVGLTDLNLFGNGLSSLPPGVFDGLIQLTQVRLGGNAVDPMLLVLGLQQVGVSEYRAVISTGAPFDILLPIRVERGEVLGNVSIVKIPVGHTHSASFIVRGTAGVDVAPTVHIGGLPSLPRNHYGYMLSLSEVCNRTPQVAAAIARAVGVEDCNAVTEVDLARVRTLELSGVDVKVLRSDDFRGLYSLVRLILADNALASLPAGIFEGLGGLRELDLSGNRADFALPVSLEKVDTSAFKAVLPHGAPFPLRLMIRMNNGAVTDTGVTEPVLTIPQGATESLPVAITRTAGTWEVVTASIVLPLPMLPETHTGYKLVLSQQTLTVFPVLNTPPVFTEGSTAVREIAENTLPGVNIGEPLAAVDQQEDDTLRYVLGGKDAAIFAIDSRSGQLQTKAALDYETKSSYSVTVSVFDDAGEGAKISVTINITPPVFTEGSTVVREIAENTLPGVNIGEPLAAVDQQEDDTLRYVLGGKDAAIFAIDSRSGQLQTKAVLDYETKSSYSVTVSVFDDAGEGAKISVTINIDNVNEAPVFTEGESTTRAVAKNVSAGISFGAFVAATDPDGDLLTWRITGGDADVFSIDSTTGQLKTSVALDDGTKSIYTVSIRVADGKLTDTINVIINVTDVLEEWMPDANLRAAVWSNLGLQAGEEFTQAALKEIYKLVAQRSEISDISGLEYATNLIYVDLCANSISDISALSGLTSLTELRLCANSISDISALSGLTSLTYLDLCENSISDISALSGLTSLTELGLCENSISDISALSGLTSLTYLDLYENSISDISALSGLTSLTYLDLYENSISDISALSGLTSLTELGLGSNFISDVTPLEDLTALSVLYLELNPITNYGPLRGLQSKTTQDIDIDIDITRDHNTENWAPFFTEGDITSRVVAEDAGLGVEIGTAVAATDADEDTLTYTLGGPDASLFRIDSTTGQLRTHVFLDYETKNAYKVIIKASDGTLTDGIVVTIIVTDVAEAPENRVTPVKDRTRQVRDAIVDAVAGVTAAADVTAEHLAAITHLSLRSGDIEDLKSGDFSGLTSLLTLDLSVNFIEFLPSGIFDNLTSLLTLDLSDNFIEFLPSGIFDNLTSLLTLDLSDNLLEFLPSGIFDNLTSLLTLDLSDNSLDEEEPLVQANRAPVFTAGDSATRSIPENTASGTDIGTPVSATDADDDTLTYELSGTDAASFGIVSSSGQLQTKAALDYETKASYSVSISVSDGNGGSDSITVTINVTDVQESPVVEEGEVQANRAPVFTAGDSATRSIPENTASGTDIGTPVSATDADDDTLTYELSGTDAASFGIVSSSGQLQTKAALDYETKASYSVSISVSDGNGGSDSITVTINVTDVQESPPVVEEGEVQANRAPVFTEGDSATRSIPEHTSAGQNIGTSVPATDADGDALTYELSGPDAASFSIVSSSGQLQTKAALDYETKLSYTVLVGVSDGNGGTDSITVTINVTDVQERPPVFTEGDSATRSIPENTGAGQNIGTPVSATDADNDSLTYTLTGTDASAFSIVSSSGQLQTKAALDYETKASYTVLVGVSDGNGGSDSITITIDVTDVAETPGNNAPVFTEGDSALRSIPENTGAGQNIGTPVSATDADNDSLTYTLTGTDASAFGIVSSSGQLQTKAALDYETKASYSVSISVSDGNGGTDSITVTINVTDVQESPPVVEEGEVQANRAPVFTEGDSATRSIPENTGAGQNIGTPVSATDADNDSLTYTLTGTDASAFGIVSSSGQLQTKAALDYETKASYTVLVGVSDGNGGSDSITITIDVTDVAETPGNNAPVFTEGDSATRSIPENTSAGQNIGTPVSATDADNDSLTYTLTGTDASAFSIVSSSGQLQTKAALDYETKASYTVLVGVSDGNGGSDSITITIDVTDVAEMPGNNAPVFTEGDNNTRRILDNTGAGQNIGDPVSATDADDDVLTYELSGPDAASFSIVSSSGQLQTKAALDYETKASYTVLVGVSDGNGGSDSITITIYVDPIDGVDISDGIFVSPSLVVHKPTLLFANYPNPFNPETWIPYQLGKPAHVLLTIYDIRGNVMRKLNIGHKPAGVYISRSRAAHWDGRNAHGERVASGLYFYTLRAGDFTATRKMLILE